MTRPIFWMFLLVVFLAACNRGTVPTEHEPRPDSLVQLQESMVSVASDSLAQEHFPPPPPPPPPPTFCLILSQERLEEAPIAEYYLVSGTAAHNYAAPEPIKQPEPKIAQDGPILPPQDSSSEEEYGKLVENPFVATRKQHFSTFSIDVDNASYSNIRRMIQEGQRPIADAVRIEEMINYFDYDYPQPEGEHPFSITTEMAAAPWNPEHQLVHIGLQGKWHDSTARRPNNLVFLIDVSGSMSAPNKLPLVKESFKILVEKLEPKDRVAIVVYAGAAGVVLPSTPISQKDSILAALERLGAGGSTAGGIGIQRAYAVALENWMPDGNNRVILATDGDFNVGISNTDELVKVIEEKRRSGVYLTICGYGMGNYKDDRLERISNSGNGNYFYVDNLDEAQKVFSRELMSNINPLCNDVKLQIEFDPRFVRSYRLIGYENRMLRKEDFTNDAKDAGEMGEGHSVTAIYEIVPATKRLHRGEWLHVNVRYKPIGSDQSILVKAPYIVQQLDQDGKAASERFRFSAAVAGWGLLLRESKYKGDLTYPMLLELAQNAKGADLHGDRAEMIQLMETAAKW